MDKFGFFKLLNSFLPPAEPKTDSGDEKTDALSNFMNSLSEQNFNKNDGQNEPQKQHKENSAPRPLQASMLNVMSAHDEFIKRVNSKNKQPNS